MTHKSLLRALTIVVLGGALLTACKGKQQQSAQQTPAAFKTVKVKAEDRTIETKYSATIRGRQDIQVLPYFRLRISLRLYARLHSSCVHFRRSLL